jgi:hypothetical protein
MLGQGAGSSQDVKYQTADQLRGSNLGGASARRATPTKESIDKLNGQKIGQKYLKNRN